MLKLAERPGTVAIRAIQDRLVAKSGADAFVSFHGADGESERFTWDEFWGLVGGYAADLAQDTREGDFLLVMSRTRVESVACFFAAIAANRLVSFFPPPHRIQDQDSYLKQQASAIAKIRPGRILVFDEATRDVVRDMGFDHLLRSLKRPAANDGRGTLDALVRRMDDPTKPLFLQHSSGTTGIKKAVAIDTKMLAAQFESYWARTIETLAPQPRIASWLPLYHDMGLIATLILPTLGGAQMAFVDPFTWVERPQNLLDIIAHEGSNLVWMPNFAYRHYARLRRGLQPRDLSGVRAWINCSEQCRASDAEVFESALADMGVKANSVVGCYAMAEAVFAVSQGDVEDRAVLHADAVQTPGTAVKDGKRAILSSGVLVPGATVKVFHDGRALEDGRYGEIGIHGDFVFGGYHDISAQASNITPDGFFMTGDLGVLRDRNLFVFGRTKETIIVNGKNIFASDLETTAGSIDGVKSGRLVAFGVENEMTGSEDIVIVAERDGTERPETAISADISRLVVATFGVMPKEVSLVGDRWLVKTTSGKISRAENRDKYMRNRHVHAG